MFSGIDLLFGMRPSVYIVADLRADQDKEDEDEQNPDRRAGKIDPEEIKLRRADLHIIVYQCIC